MPTGTVSRLWRWPVKSMAGEELRALSLGPRGVGGDRSHAVLHEHKGAWRPLTAREAPRLLAWRAAYPFNLDRRPGPCQSAARGRHRAGRREVLALGRPASERGARARPRPAG